MNIKLEKIYDILKHRYEGNSHFKTYTVRDNKGAFCFWDQVSYYENRHKKLTFICEACIEDQLMEVQQLVLDFKLKSTCYRLDKNVFPCGCAKKRSKTLLYYGIDNFIGKTKEYGGNISTISECIGGIGNKKKYIVICSSCSKDKELWPYGSIVTTKSNFITRELPNCDCNPNKVVRSESQIVVLIKRLCEKKSLRFLGWTDGVYVGTNNTRMLLECPYHGISKNTRVEKFLCEEGGCRDCAQELGNFGYYPNQLDKEDNLYLLKCESDCETFYKIGRSFNIERRIKQHIYLSGYNIRLESFITGKHSDIFKLEQKILLETNYCKYIPKNVWQGSYRECRTPVILDHPKVIEIFNNKK